MIRLQRRPFKTPKPKIIWTRAMCFHSASKHGFSITKHDSFTSKIWISKGNNQQPLPGKLTPQLTEQQHSNDIAPFTWTWVQKYWYRNGYQATQVEPAVLTPNTVSIVCSSWDFVYVSNFEIGASVSIELSLSFFLMRMRRREKSGKVYKYLDQSFVLLHLISSHLNLLSFHYISNVLPQSTPSRLF